MKKLSIISIPFLIVGSISIFFSLISYVAYLQTVEHLKIECSKPGSSCPIADDEYYVASLEIGIILLAIGIILLVINSRNK
jgi:hypothetical protein